MTIQPMPGTIEPNTSDGPSRATLPALAKAIAEWFPELEGRSLAVSEAKITRENVPTLPIVMVSLIREMGNHAVQTGRIEPVEEIVVEFWFKPERYLNDKGGETPFWAFYDYDKLRDKFLSYLKHWRSPRGEALEYFSLELDSDPFATVIAFRLRHKFVFCELTPIDDGDGVLITDNTFLIKLCNPKAFCTEIPEPEIDPCITAAQQPTPEPG